MLMLKQTSARAREASSRCAASCMCETGSGTSGYASMPHRYSSSSCRFSAPFRYRKPEPALPIFPVTAGSIATLRTVLPPVGWRCRP